MSSPAEHAQLFVYLFIHLHNLLNSLIFLLVKYSLFIVTLLAWCRVVEVFSLFFLNAGTHLPFPEGWKAELA